MITGRSPQEHWNKVEEVSQWLDDWGFKLRRDKCHFLQSAVEYLGYRIDAAGLHAATAKIDAILNAPRSADVRQLRSFLGLINYYSCFIPKLSTVAHSSIVFWNFSEMKMDYWVWNCFSSSEAMANVNSSFSALWCPVLYKTGLWCISIWDRSNISNRSQAISDYVGSQISYAARLQSWVLLLSGYQYEVEFHPTAHHGNTDCLSWLPIHPQPENSLLYFFTSHNLIC